MAVGGVYRNKGGGQKGECDHSDGLHGRAVAFCSSTDVHGFCGDLDIRLAVSLDNYIKALIIVRMRSQTEYLEINEPD